jgi:hypothetical protein
MNEQVLEKLKKILRLADNEGATTGEAEAAMARAKEIAMQNNIDLSTIDFSDPNAKAKSFDIQKGTVGFSSSREYPYHRWVTHVIKECFGVFVVRLHAGYAFIGDANDVATSKEIFPWLEKVYKRTFEQKCKEGELFQCAADRNGFYRGLTDGLLEVNKRTVRETLAKQSVDTNKYAIVLRNKADAIEKAVPNFFPNLRKGRRTSTADSNHARGLGRVEGRKVRLNQVGGQTSRGQLS